MLWARYPRHKKEQAILRSHNIGAVTSTTWSGYTYPDGDYTAQPNTTKLEQRLATLPADYPLHAHTIVAKGPGALWEAQEPHLEEMCYRILDQYADRINRWTIATELLIKREHRIVELYERIHERYPHLELWVCEYGLNSVYFAQGLQRIIYELKAACDLKGIILVDYLDLRPNAIGNQLIQAMDRFIPVTRDLVQQYNPEDLPGWLQVFTAKLAEAGVDMAARAKLAGLDKFSRNMDRIASTGVQVALETSVFAGEDSTPKEQARQIMAYRMLHQICEHHGADFWHWNLFDSDFGAPWLNVTEDSCGYFDQDGNVKDWARELLP